MEAADIDPNERQNTDVQLNTHFADNLEKKIIKKPKNLPALRTSSFLVPSSTTRERLLVKKREKMALN